MFVKRIYNITIIVIALFVICSAEIYAQENPLKKGDKVPDLQFSNLINHDKPTLKLSDLKSKLIVFRFWNTYCKSCITEMPSIDSLQNLYKDKIKIILVNDLQKDSVLRFFKYRSSIKMPGNLFITQDNILKKLFPHRSIPFQVWIDSSLHVLAFPPEYELNEQNIDKYLSDKDLKIHEKNNSTVLREKNLFGESYKDKIKYYSYLIPCIDRLEISSNTDKDKIGLISNSCESIINLYLQAYSERDNEKKALKYDLYSPGRVILEIMDSLKYHPPKNRTKEFEEWRNANTYTYQLSLPSTQKGNEYKFMQEDLNRFFGLNAKIEKRPVKCIKLIRTSKQDKIKTKGGASKSNLLKDIIHDMETGEIRYVENRDYKQFSNFVRSIVEAKFNKTFFDLTDYHGNVDIRLEGINNITNVNQFNSLLIKYDLKLIEVVERMEVLIISDKNLINVTY